MKDARSTRSIPVRQRPRRTRGERGAVMVIGALMFAFLAMPLCAVGVDMARWWVEAQRLQAAADAASTAGVTFMPDDFDKAKARAIEIAASNGYTAGTGTTITVSPGSKPTQLRVVIAQLVNNTFAQSFGISTSKVTRGAVADYNGPAPMGSPCNTFGNEPLGTTTRGPQDSQLPGMVPPLANCSSNPQFWANIGGPDWPKGNGDQFMTRSCSGTDGCDAGRNTEFDPRGYYYVIRIAPGAVGKRVYLQLYDPAFVAQGDYCETGPGGTAVDNDNWNAYTTTDAKTRYKKQASGATNSFCTGDVASTTVPTVTSFGLRGTTDTNDPRNAPPIAGCVRQYPGYAAADLTGPNLKNPIAGTSKDNLAKVFHQWVTMCSFIPTQAGEHFLQVRTNVRLDTGSPDGEGGYQGNMNVYNQTGDDSTVGGGGANRFAIRAYAAGVAAGDISVSAFERMPIYANATGANSEFNLVRVIPAAASKTLVFGFFDVGEAASGGTMQVLPPADSNMSSNISNCTGSGKVNGTLTDCKITGISSSGGWNGRSQFIRVPIPNNYTCNTTTPGGCWFRIGVNFGAGNVVNDSTTWSAKIEGEPIRLIE
jgi:Flp pilus assembly protein TadG